jgi:hypothetical protein
MSCQYAHLDGSYVLGALSPAERQQYEEHLAGCQECTQAVLQLAGLPGLLAKVDPASLEPEPTEDPVPTTLLPALVGEVRRRQRRRHLVTAAAAAAVAVIVTVVSLVVERSLDSEDGATATPPETTSPTATLPEYSPTQTPPETGPTETTPPVSHQMEPLGGAPVRATLAFEAMPWGTRLDLTCTYVKGGHDYGPPGSVRYGMFVQTRDGRTEQVATWRAAPGDTMHLSGATDADRRDISLVEIRTAEGTPVLKLSG